MREVRCGNCRKKLFEGSFSEIDIKCPRCGTMHKLRTQSPEPEGRRAPDSGVFNAKAISPLDGR
jgi:phage FluMu protein Com